MNRRLQYVNLFGVLALAGLCLLQWRHDRGLNLELIRSEKARLGQTDELAEKAATIQGLNEDLAQLKISLSNERALRLESDQKLKSNGLAIQQLTSESAQLKTAMTNWSHAVALRDERLKTANSRIDQLADELNASIRKYNELVTNYNSVVNQLNAQSKTNELPGKPAASSP